MRSDASSTWMSFLGAACVAPPALQFPAQTECTQLELRSCAGGPEHQFNNNNKSCKDTARNHFPQFTSLLGKRLPKSFLLTDPPLIYRLKITVMEELPAWKALPSAVHQTWVSSFSQKAFITGPSEKLRARLCCLAWHRGAHRETYAEVLSCSGGSVWIGNSETEAVSKAGLQPTPLWCTEGHCQVCGAFEIGEEASSRLRQEAKGADRILAGRTETYCSVSEALIELNSGPEEFCSSTAKQLTTPYKPLLAQLTLFHVCCTLYCLTDPCTYPSGAWSVPTAEPSQAALTGHTPSPPSPGQLSLLRAQPHEGWLWVSRRCPAGQRWQRSTVKSATERETNPSAASGRTAVPCRAPRDLLRGQHRHGDVKARKAAYHLQER